MSEIGMVERVALAMHERRVGSRTEWADCAPEWRAGLRADARAAIAEMREPTEAILESVYGEIGETSGSSEPARQAWANMIDAALK